MFIYYLHKLLKNIIHFRKNINLIAYRVVKVSMIRS